MAEREGSLEGMVTRSAQPAASPFRPTPVFWRGKRIFLTGHTGFKGAWLTLWLSLLGARVRGYALAPESEPSMYMVLALDELCDSQLADIRDSTRLTQAIGDFQPEVVIHMAAQSLVRPSYRNPRETFEVNVQGTVNVLDACRHVDSVRAVVVVTTDKCYENRESLWAYREDDALGGHDPYSASKACAELVTTAYRRSFFCGKDTAAVATARAGNVIGGGDWSVDRIIPDAVRAFSAGQPLVVRNPEAVRPWQHVTGPLCGYLMLARALYEAGSEFAQAFNFGPASDQILPVRTLVEHAARAWGDGAAWEDHSEQAAPHEASMLMLDPTRARHLLGWTPDNGVSRAIDKTVEWYKAYYTDGRADAMRRLTGRSIAELEPASGMPS